MMRKTWCAVFVVCLAFSLTTLVRADDQADLKAVIDKAIKARGGEEKLSKIKAEIRKSKGKFYGMGDAIEYTMTQQIQTPDKEYAELDFEAGGMKFKFLQVANGKKGWRKINDMLMDLDADAVKELQADIYASELGNLVALKDKKYQLSSLGEVKVGDAPAVGIKVTAKNKRDVNLYFDKTSGLILKMEMRVKDESAGAEVTQETLFSNYKDVDGVKQPMKIIINRDGKLYVDDETTELKTVDSIDEKLLEKP